MTASRRGIRTLRLGFAFAPPRLVGRSGGGMEKISPGRAFLVHPAGRVERGDAVLHYHVPFTLVDERVVMAAEQEGIVDRSITAV